MISWDSSEHFFAWMSTSERRSVIELSDILVDSMKYSEPEKWLIHSSMGKMNIMKLQHPSNDTGWGGGSSQIWRGSGFGKRRISRYSPFVKRIFLLFLPFSILCLLSAFALAYCLGIILSALCSQLWAHISP